MMLVKIEWKTQITRAVYARTSSSGKLLENTNCIQLYVAYHSKILVETQC